MDEILDFREPPSLTLMGVRPWVSSQHVWGSVRWGSWPSHGGRGHRGPPRRTSTAGAGGLERRRGLSSFPQLEIRQRTQSIPFYWVLTRVSHSAEHMTCISSRTILTSVWDGYNLFPCSKWGHNDSERSSLFPRVTQLGSSKGSMKNLCMFCFCVPSGGRLENATVFFSQLRQDPAVPLYQFSQTLASLA